MLQQMAFTGASLPDPPRGLPCLYKSTMQGMVEAREALAELYSDNSAPTGNKSQCDDSSNVSFHGLMRGCVHPMQVQSCARTTQLQQVTSDARGT
jgi:hypothetical protein